MVQQDPTGPNEAVLQGNPVSQIPADRAEGMLSLLKLTPYGQQSSMGDLIGQHHQTRLANAQMYSNAAKTAMHAQLLIQHGIDPDTGTRFDDPAYKGPSAEDQAARYQANYNEAWTNYKKLAGVDQNTKGALAKAEQILNHILGGGAMQSAPGAPSNQGRPGGMAPPPQAQAGLSGTAGGPSQVEAAAPASTPTKLTPPPRSGDEGFALAAPMIEANTQFQQGQQRATAEQQRKFKTDIEQRTKEADILDLPEGSRERRQYIATGNFPAVFGLQSKPIEFTDENGKIQRVIANYDKTNGTYEYNGKIITNPRIADKPQLIKYIKTDTNGRPHLIGGFMLGTQLYDQQMNPLPPNTEFYSRGLFGTDTLHQQITIGPNGEPMINTLERVSSPTYSKAIWGDEQPTGVGSSSPAVTGAPPAGPGAAPLRKGGLPAAPKREVTGSGVPVAQSGGGRAPKMTDATGRPLGISSGMYNTQVSRAIPVREAATQLFGDPTQPDMKSMKDFSHLADDPAARERLAKAFQITFNGLQDEETKSGGLWNLIQLYGGMPQAIATARSKVREDVIGGLKGHPDEVEAYDVAMNTYGSLVGLRSLSKASASNASVQKLEQEMPLVGLNSMSSEQYNDQLSRIAENVYSGTRTLNNIVMTPDEKEYYKAQVSSLKKGKGGAAPPPKPGGAPATPAKSVDDQIMELIGGGKKKP